MNKKLISVLVTTPTLSRLAGGLFYSVRGPIKHYTENISITVVGKRDKYYDNDISEWSGIKTKAFEERILEEVLGVKEVDEINRKECFDIIHQHGIWNYSSVIKRNKNQLKIISARGMLDSWALKKGSYKKYIYKALYEDKNIKSSTVMHALNEDESEAIRRYGYRGPIAVIPNGINLTSKCMRMQEKTLKRRKKLLYLGRINSKKNIKELIRAWSILNKNEKQVVEDWELVIVGWDDGGELKALKLLCEKENICETVSFPGQAYGQDKELVLNDSDAFILPSLSEGLPMSVLEAWAHRLPVFMTKSCNLDIAFNLGAAILIGENAESIAETLKLNINRSDLVDVAERGFQLVSERYTWNQIAVDFEATYKWMLGLEERPKFIIG